MKLLFLFLLLKLIKGTEHAQSHNIDNAEIATAHVVQKWLNMDAFLKKTSTNFVKSLLPLFSDFISSPVISSNCTRSLVDFLRGITQTKQWAFKMLDSSGKLPNGITGGSLVSLGDYDTCLDVDVANYFQGKYCLVDIGMSLPKLQDFRPDAEQIPGLINISGSDTIIDELLKNGRRLYLSQPRTSVCVPSTCSRDDVQKIVSKVLDIFGLKLLDVNVKSCEAKNDVINFSSSDKVIMLILGTLIVLVISATIFDIFKRFMIQKLEGEEDKLSHYLLYFSLITNGIQLFKKDENPDSIRVFHGMRIISILWIILGHTYVIIHFKAYNGLYHSKDLHKSFWFQFIANAYPAVETFFFMCAVLLAYSVTRYKEKNLTIAVVFVHRYIRITIPHLLMIACVWLLPFLSSGPLYKEIIGHHAQNCKDGAWKNVLYISNYLPLQKMCLPETWFLSTDTQLFLISLVILILFKKSPKVMFVLIGISFAFGFVGTVLSHVIYRLPPATLALNLQVEYRSYLHKRSYYLPHFHLPTYSVGLMVGYVLATRKTLHVTKKMNVILWISSLAVIFGVVFGVYGWNNGSEFPGLLPSVLYGSTHRLLWALSLAWITISCHFEKKGLVSRFLGSESFVPLGRITFMAYLTHMNVVHLYFGTIRHTITYNHMTMLFLYFGFAVVTIMASTILTLIFEAPFLRLQKDVMRKLMDSETVKGH